MAGTVSKIIVFGLMLGALLQMADIATIPVNFTEIASGNPAAIAAGFANTALGPLNLVTVAFNGAPDVVQGAVLLLIGVPLSVLYGLAWFAWIRGKPL